MKQTKIKIKKGNYYLYNSKADVFSDSNALIKAQYVTTDSELLNTLMANKVSFTYDEKGTLTKGDDNKNIKKISHLIPTMPISSNVLLKDTELIQASENFKIKIFYAKDNIKHITFINEAYIKMFSNVCSNLVLYQNDNNNLSLIHVYNNDKYVGGIMPILVRKSYLVDLIYGLQEVK